MDKDRVLPLVFVPHDYVDGAEWQKCQRDADLIILERDYVARARVKPLVEALEEIRDGSGRQRDNTMNAQEIADAALVRFGVGVSDGAAE